MKCFILIVLILSANNSFGRTKETFFSIKGYVRETSGAAFDQTNGAIWIIGDSDGDRLGHVDLTTGEKKVIPVKGIVGSDREELHLDSKNNLWIFSTGNNHHGKHELYLNRLNPSFIDNEGSLTVDQTITIVFPDGNKDIEGAWIDGDIIYLIEKSFTHAARIYTINIENEESHKQVATYYNKIGKLPLGITAACLDQNRELFFTTYWGVYRLPMWDSGQKLRPKLIRFSPTQGQVETIVCYRDRLLLANESGRFYF